MVELPGLEREAGISSILLAESLCGMSFCKMWRGDYVYQELLRSLTTSMLCRKCCAGLEYDPIFG